MLAEAPVPVYRKLSDIYPAGALGREKLISLGAFLGDC